MTLQWEYNSNTLITADIDSEDTSFEHEFGIQKQARYVIKDFAVFVFNFGIEVDITSHLIKFEPKLYLSLKEETLKHFAGEREL